jgi:hypothetical protein
MQIRNCVTCGDWLTGKDREAAQKNGGLCRKCATKGGHESTRMYVLAQLASESSGRLPPASPLMKQLAQETTAAPANSRKPKDNGPTLPQQIPTPEFPPKGADVTPYPGWKRVVVIHFCSKCNKRLSNADILLGRPRHKQGDSVFCSECAQAAQQAHGEGVLGLLSGTKSQQRRAGRG